jgi:hypothetical protein
MDGNILDVRVCGWCQGEGDFALESGVEHMGVKEYMHEMCGRCNGYGYRPVNPDAPPLGDCPPGRLDLSGEPITRHLEIVVTERPYEPADPDRPAHR